MSERIKSVIIAGIFTVIAACISGMFLLIIALLQKDWTFIQFGNSQSQPTEAGFSNLTYVPPSTTQPNVGNTTMPTIYNCPTYQQSEKGKILILDINVPANELAFIDAWGFDDKTSGVFVTITGPYSGTHKITDGAYCWGIPQNANYEPVKQQRLQMLNEPFQRVFLGTPR